MTNDSYPQFGLGDIWGSREVVADLCIQMVGNAFPTMNASNQQQVADCLVGMFQEMCNREVSWTSQTSSSEQGANDLPQTAIEDIRRQMIKIAVERILLAFKLIGLGLK
jgi:hypothetical protein